MAGRLQIFLKKTRRCQMGFLVVAILCLLVFLLLLFSLNDKEGAFEAIYHAPYQLEVPISRQGLTHLDIESSNVTLELGMADDIHKPVVQLFGKGYKEQSVKIDLKDTKCHIALKDVGKSTPQALTMRVLLPQSNLHEVKINGQLLNLHVEHLRASKLVANVDKGYVAIIDTKGNHLKVKTVSAPVRLSHNRMTFVETDTEKGSSTFIENHMNYLEAHSEQGSQFLYQRWLNKHYELNSQKGDVTVLSQYLPYNIFIDAQTTRKGSVSMRYQTRFWKETLETENNKHTYIGSVGGDTKHLLICKSESGHIDIGPRERYSPLDPFAKDYPFAAENPYRQERATYTK